MNAEPSYARHLRIAGISTGFGSIVFGLLALGDIVKDFPHLSPWFAWPATILFFSLPVAFIPVGRLGSVAVLQALARAHTVVALTILVGWAPMQHGRIPDGAAPWILNTVAIAAASAVVAWRSRVAWPLLIAMAVTGSILRWVDFGRTTLVIPLEDGLSILEVSVVIAALLMVSLAAGRAQDAALARAVVNARAAAEAESRARQRTRFGALVHDDVITTLLAASQATRRMVAIERSAERAIHRLDAFAAPSSDDLQLNPKALEIEVRAAVTEVVDGVEFSGSFQDSSAEFPGEVAVAVTDALREAARNSMHHAGAEPIRRRVLMHATARALSVEFTDEGAGFDPARVAESRFGIRTSIVDRMAAVGGSAEVRSAPGRGTTIALAWWAAQ